MVSLEFTQSTELHAHVGGVGNGCGLLIQRGRDMPDRKITCKDCGQSFEFSEKDQQFFKKNNWNDPIRCRPCRNIAKQRRPKQDQQTG